MWQGGGKVPYGVGSYFVIWSWLPYSLSKLNSSCSLLSRITLVVGNHFYLPSFSLLSLFRMVVAKMAILILTLWFWQSCHCFHSRDISIVSYCFFLGIHPLSQVWFLEIFTYFYLKFTIYSKVILEFRGRNLFKGGRL